ncbi:MAG TPA: DUF3450 family protein [Candidatus Polarisedimenticolaceae bacterium]|nr:DUF3450 family protein [Candidatus Polarisedimenticolaceae bacterium]
MAAGLCAHAADGPTPDSTRATLAKWVETQQIIAKERQEWEQGKSILQSRIEAVRGEIAATSQRLEDARRAAADANAKKAGEVAESARLQESGARLQAWAVEMEGGLRALEPRLPDPLRQKIRPLFERIPADPKSTAVSLAERYQNIVGILNEIGKFNNDITMVTEVRTLSDGKPAEVRTVYVGLAQAYFVSAKGDAGIGRPAASGWEWTQASEIAPRIAEAVEILQNKAKPQFVSLPVKVQ